MTHVDETDRKILRILQKDSRTPIAKIAEHVGLSTTTCWRRVSSLEQSGIIRRFGIVLDPAVLGLDFQAIVNIQLTRHDREKIDAFFDAIMSQPEVRECYAVTGQYDYQMFINCSDVASYNKFLEEFLFMNPAVASAQTNMVLKTIKEHDITV